MSGNAANYTMRDIPGGTEFIVTPIPIQTNAGTTVAFILLGLVLLFLAMLYKSTPTFIAVLFCFLIAYLLQRSGKKNSEKISIIVTSGELTIGSFHLALDNLHGLHIRNNISREDQNIDPAYLALSTSMARVGDYATSSLGAMHTARAGLKARKMRDLAAISYRLDVEAGGRATTIASGLDDVTVRGLATDIQRKLPAR